MIIDRIENAASYTALGPVWEKAFEIAKNYDVSKFVHGKTDMGDGISLVQLEYETKAKENCLLEAHRKYADLMFIAEGAEVICCKPLDTLTDITTEYDESIEALLAKMNDDVLDLHMTPGTFVVFLPQDAHGAGIAEGAPAKVRRIVSKVPLF